VAAERVLVMDRQEEPRQVERILCFSAETGERLWDHSYECLYTISYPAGPRATVAIDGSLAFALGAMGHVHCLQLDDGRVVWSRDLNSELKIQMPIWGIAAAPLVYDDLLILQIGGSDGACLVGLDKRSGQSRWKALDERAGYSAPVITRQTGRDVLIAWTGDSVSGLSPETGELFWRVAFTPTRMPIGIATPVIDGSRVLVTSFYDGSMMIELSQERLEARKLWHKLGPDEQNTEALHSIISTPILRGNDIFGVDSYGELRCLDATNGVRIWEDQTATPRARWSTIHFVRNGDRYWMFNERGDLIIARLTRQGFEEISRAQIISPTIAQLSQRGGVCWAHPAFADRHVFARNDETLVCVDLAADR
jgi:outer membrane protein assembly factor BamB